jgi:hypothetical protein
MVTIVAQWITKLPSNRARLEATDSRGFQRQPKNAAITLVDWVVFLAYRTEEQKAELFEIALKRRLAA